MTQGALLCIFWLSFSFVFSEKPLHTVLLGSKFVENATKMIVSLDRAASKPIMVALCPDSMFNMIESRTTRIASELEETLRSKGMLVTTDTRMAKLPCKLRVALPNARQRKKGHLGEDHERLLLMCSSNREKVNAMNELAGKTATRELIQLC